MPGVVGLTEGDPTIRACQAFTRDPLNGGIVSLDLSYTNEGRALTSGMDVQLNWSSNFASRPGGINVNVLANYNLKNITQAAPEVAAVDWVGTRGCALQLQCMGYDYRVFTTFNYFRGPWNATVRWSHLPSIKAGAAATNPNTTAIGVRSSYDVFALTGSYRWNENIMFRLGIENLFNRKPPMAGGNPDASNYPLAPTRAGGAYYDPLGRRMFLGVSVAL
jgi:iron complex outermembrane recepter protein